MANTKIQLPKTWNMLFLLGCVEEIPFSAWKDGSLQFLHGPFLKSYWERRCRFNFWLAMAPTMRSASHVGRSQSLCQRPSSNPLVWQGLESNGISHVFVWYFFLWPVYFGLLKIFWGVTKRQFLDVLGMVLFGFADLPGLHGIVA